MFPQESFTKYSNPHNTTRNAPIGFQEKKSNTLVPQNNIQIDLRYSYVYTDHEDELL